MYFPIVCQLEYKQIITYLKRATIFGKIDTKSSNVPPINVMIILNLKNEF